MLRRLAAHGVSTALLSAGLAAAPVAAVPAEAGWTQARAVAPLVSGMTTRTRPRPPLLP